MLTCHQGPKCLNYYQLQLITANKGYNDSQKHNILQIFMLKVEINTEIRCPHILYYTKYYSTKKNAFWSNISRIEKINVLSVCVMCTLCFVLISSTKPIGLLIKTCCVLQLFSNKCIVSCYCGVERCFQIENNSLDPLTVLAV